MKQITVGISTLVMSVILLIVTTLLINSWTVKVVNNRDVIDFVSFAGTVIGIILAILAIIYSYISNSTQAQDASLLKTEIGRLSDTVSKARSYSDLLSGELNRLEEIRQDLAEVKLSTRQTRESVEGLKASAREKMDLGGGAANDGRSEPAARAEEGTREADHGTTEVGAGEDGGESAAADPNNGQTTDLDGSSDEVSQSPSTGAVSIVPDELEEGSAEGEEFLPALRRIASDALAFQVIDYYVAVAMLESNFSDGYAIVDDTWGLVSPESRDKDFDRCSALALTFMDLDVREEHPNGLFFKKSLLRRLRQLDPGQWERYGEDITKAMRAVRRKLRTSIT